MQPSDLQATPSRKAAVAPDGRCTVVARQALPFHRYASGLPCPPPPLPFPPTARQSPACLQDTAASTLFAATVAAGATASWGDTAILGEAAVRALSLPASPARTWLTGEGLAAGVPA